MLNVSGGKDIIFYSNEMRADPTVDTVRLRSNKEA